MHRKTLPRTAVAFSLAAASLLAVSACAATVDVTAATDAANPACAPMMVALPDKIGDAALRKTNSQATAAWGDPSQIILRCGVNVPGPTTDRCVSVNDIDWVIKEGDGVYTLTTFGREPATEILVDPVKLEAANISSATVLTELAAAAGKIRATRHCVGQEDLQNLPTSK
ncbi:multidrug efflux pump subunit AcrB [Arthrobacter sp. 2762]